MTALKLYRPSNGTEGAGFIDAMCGNCQRGADYCDEPDAPGCGILGRAMLYEIDDPKYPREWRYGDDGNPTCTAFVPLGGQVPTDRDREAAGQLTLMEAA